MAVPLNATLTRNISRLYRGLQNVSVKPTNKSSVFFDILGRRAGGFRVGSTDIEPRSPTEKPPVQE